MMAQQDLKAKIDAVCREALQQATPDEKERRETLLFSEDLVKRLEVELRRAGIEGEVQIEGSIAKDTWLKGEKDIDLFVLLPKTYGTADFTKVLDAAKRIAGENWLEAYAEHPYIEAKIDEFTVDFVPCFKVEDAKEAVSSVDRTPLHTVYVTGRLSPQMRNEVRLLKRFMRGIGAYGAEIKVGGFSGYLCEVLTMYHGSFNGLLDAAANWHGREVIDIEKHYAGKENEARKIFREPLIVVDPVDKGRNVASAVRPDRLSEFIAASREFLKTPSLSFFYPKPVEALTVSELAHKMETRGSTFVFLKTNVARAVPDVLWGQLYRSQKALAALIQHHGFTLTRNDVWSDEKGTAVFIFEAGSRFLPAAEKHLGPPIEKKTECERFLKKYVASAEVLSGPRIEGNRWVVERKRKHPDLVGFLQDCLKDGGRGIGNSSLVFEAFKHSLTIWVNDEAKGFYSKNAAFASFLSEHLRGRPSWLR